MKRRARVGTVLVAAVVASGCADAVTSPLYDRVSSEPSRAVVGVGGSVLDGSGANICGSWAGGSTYSVTFFRVIDGGPDVASGTSGTLTCPNNTWSRALEQGRYVARITTDAALGVTTSQFPRSVYDTFTVTSATSTEHLTVARGRAIRGGATMNGVRIEDANVNVMPLISDGLPANYATTLISNIDGTWDEFLPSSVAARPTPYLHAPTMYRPTCGALRGARVNVPPDFIPRDNATLTCRYLNAASRRWTHLGTALAVTPGPGNFDFTGRDSSGGYGFGIQYPVTDTIPSRIFFDSLQHVYHAGFVVSVGDVVLSALEGNFLECGATCRDLRPTAYTPTAPRTAVIPSGTEVTWRMNDATSAEKRGIEITQTSFDGTGGDYVLFRLTLKNNSGGRRTVNLGFFADWDVANGVTSQSTAIINNLAYATLPGGPFLGSVFFGTFASRGYLGISSGDPLPLASQRGVLNGTLNNSGASGDVRYMQSVGPMTLASKTSRVVWFALVAGQTLPELQANTAAAKADMNARLP